jgi:hypothetical protein
MGGRFIGGLNGLVFRQVLSFPSVAVSLEVSMVSHFDRSYLSIGGRFIGGLDDLAFRQV